MRTLSGRDCALTCGGRASVRARKAATIFIGEPIDREHPYPEGTRPINQRRNSLTSDDEPGGVSYRRRFSELSPWLRYSVEADRTHGSCLPPAPAVFRQESRR